MENRILILSEGVPCTICSLAERHFWRVHSIPHDGAPPNPPEGYSVQQALDNIKSFREKMDAYNNEVSARRVWRTIGSARILARDLPQYEEERAAIRTLCLKYSYDDPDATDDPVTIGLRLAEIVSERAPDPTVLPEAYLWLQEKAGGIDHAVVEEILKRVRSESQRTTDSGSSPVSNGGAEQGTPDPAPDLQPVV